jgi:preprotein translocase subunit Sec63
MITLLKASRRSLIVVLPGFALLFAGCAKEAEETSSAGSTTGKPEIADTSRDVTSGDVTGGDVTGGDVAEAPSENTPKDSGEETTTGSPDPTPLIIPDTPNIPIAGSEKPEIV